MPLSASAAKTTTAARFRLPRSRHQGAVGAAALTPTVSQPAARLPLVPAPGRPEDGWRHPDRRLLVLRRRLAVALVGGPVVLAVALLLLLAGPVEAAAGGAAGLVLLGLTLLAVERRWR